MPQKEIQLKNWVLDPVTGFLTSFDKRHKFTAQVKKMFLDKLLEKRDVEEACEAVGLSRRILSAHLRADPNFNGSYEATMLLIKDPKRLQRLETVERLWKQTQA